MNRLRHRSPPSRCWPSLPYPRPRLMPRPSPNAVSPERAAALRECTTKANALVMQAWGSWPTYVYDNCMAQHGQKY